MPTPSEKKALAFAAIVVLLGGTVRVLRAGNAAPPSELEQQGVVRQVHAADSAAAAQGSSTRKKGRSRRGKASDTLPHVVGGVASVPPTYARPDQPYAKSPFGYPPPSPRIDVDFRASQHAPAGAAANDVKKVNIDKASASEIEALPLIGPALAKRIIANRDSFGAFKSLDQLHRVKGMGAKTLERLAPLVTFGP